TYTRGRSPSVGAFLQRPQCPVIFLAGNRVALGGLIVRRFPEPGIDSLGQLLERWRPPGRRALANPRDPCPEIEVANSPPLLNAWFAGRGISLMAFLGRGGIAMATAQLSRASLTAAMVGLLASAGELAWAQDRPSADVQRVQTIGFTVADVDRETSFFTRVLHFEKIVDFSLIGAEYGRLHGVFNASLRIIHF